MQGIVYWVHPDQFTSSGLYHNLNEFFNILMVLNSGSKLRIMYFIQSMFPKFLQDAFCSDPACCKSKAVIRLRQLLGLKLNFEDQLHNNRI